jgi:hypothetical protein
VNFNKEVFIIGDATKDTQIIKDDQLLDFDFLVKNGKA